VLLDSPRRLHRPSLTGPVLEPADHLLDGVAQAGQLERGTGRSVAPWPPAVHDDRAIEAEKLGRAIPDLRGGQVHRLWEVPLGPGHLVAAVDEDECVRICCKRRGDVGRVGLEAELRREVGDGFGGNGVRLGRGHGLSVALAYPGHQWQTRQSSGKVCHQRLEVRVVRDVVALVAEPVAAFELGVLCEVFGLDRSDDGLPRYSFAVAARRPGLVRTSSGFDIKVEHGLPRLDDADLIAVPGWSTSGAPAPGPVVAALHAAVERGARVLGICSGAFLLAAAGLLDGRRAAAHWRYAGRLAELFPAVAVDAAVLYVDSGPVVTTAGTAAAIDACLHLVRVDHGAAAANAIARRMVVAAHRSGGQAQFIEAAVPVEGDDRLAAVLDWAAQRLDGPISVGDWARQARMSPRTFARRFRAVTGTTPRQWLIDQRILHAQRLLEGTSLSIESVARAAGFGTGDALRHHMAARHGTTPTTHRRAFTTAANN